MFELKFQTPAAWTDGIVEAMDVFLPDHATAEKKASSMAMTMVSHYPDKPELVSAMKKSPLPFTAEAAQSLSGCR